MRRSITYRLPGGLRMTLTGEPKCYARWLLETWRAGLAVWLVWLKVAWEVATEYPKTVSRRTWERLMDAYDEILLDGDE
jgi:hypothetical protein